jgi:hypothetical protein
MNFIHESFIPDVSLCDTLISYYKERDAAGLTHNGYVIRENEHKINEDFKKSKEVFISKELYDVVFKNLDVVTKEYIDKFPWCNHYAAWKVNKVPQIQYYGPNDGFYAWHTERTSRHTECCNRHLVYMIYLNDVTDGGGTEFVHQKTTMQPVKGKTLIWPTDWTYTHRGIPSPTQDKYILTGWYEFVE